MTDTADRRHEERNPIFAHALALGSRNFILETYARFPKVFNARKRPARPFVTNFDTPNDTLCASHSPRRMVVG